MTAPGAAHLPSPTLRAWLSEHGPLATQPALVIGLHACARASHVDDDTLRAGLASLDAGHVRRDAEGRWCWSPRPAGSARRIISEADVVEQVGALLFECLAAQPPPRTTDRDAAATHLQSVRPDLPPPVVDLVARALSAGRDRDASIEGLGESMRRLLGVVDRPRPAWRRASAALAIVAVAAAAMVWPRWTGDDDERPGSHGLTPRETARYDAQIEHADYDATIGEHTYAVQGLSSVDGLLRGRLGPTDVRVRWNLAREAWVRRLAGDRITAEQYVVSAPEVLGKALGPRHPYTRVVRLALADTTAARGETATAARLRDEAERFLGQLVPEAALRPPASPGGVLWPVHTVAHLAPNAPEIEGFRQTAGGGYQHPVTSTQRVFSERDGWLLHVRAAGSCRASAVVGADPRGVVVGVRRENSGGWAMTIAGVTPALTLTAPPAPSLAMTLVGAPDGGITLRLADGTERTVRLDPAAPPPAPPYGVAFDDTTACAIVWWEITPS